MLSFVCARISDFCNVCGDMFQSPPMMISCLHWDNVVKHDAITCRLPRSGPTLSRRYTQPMPKVISQLSLTTAHTARCTCGSPIQFTCKPEACSESRTNMPTPPLLLPCTVCTAGCETDFQPFRFACVDASLMLSVVTSLCSCTRTTRASQHSSKNFLQRCHPEKLQVTMLLLVQSAASASKPTPLALQVCSQGRKCLLSKLLE